MDTFTKEKNIPRNHKNHYELRKWIFTLVKDEGNQSDIHLQTFWSDLFLEIVVSNIARGIAWTYDNTDSLESPGI